ncbi:hypothetical protein Lfu02_73180 [Longispora fulva]|uniref:Uncharacterized protein n=1 Tax=Longispora fulva TaxID=619741 RepID=A0A8J7KDC5_9ACTN|nr:hypothetical protein [Longispora fulva]MBG6133905.1 hypothetical protein [Longispora fulva]GIG62946.1 hypothetical protein Lfu02_73180 [Longispora fulva]
MPEAVTRDRTIRLPVPATAHRSAGRQQDWTIESGAFQATGRTERAAADTLTTTMTSFLTLYQRPAVQVFRGHTAIVSLEPSPDDTPMWSEHVVRPGGSTSHSWFGAESLGEALARTRYNLARASTDWRDDGSVHQAVAFLDRRPQPPSGFGAGDLARYAAWQRAAKAAIDAGVVDWHGWAGEHAKDFTVPAPGAGTWPESSTAAA